MSFDVSEKSASALQSQIFKKLDSLSSTAQFPVALKLPVPEPMGLGLLSANPQSARVFWSDRDGSDPTAGIGVAHTVDLKFGGQITDCLDRCRAVLKGNADLRFFGGLSFDGGDAWSTLGAGKFIVPRISISGDQLTLAIMSQEDIEKARFEIQQLCFDAAQPVSLPKPIGTQLVPEVDGWQTQVNDALSLIRDEVLEKIVLSRKTILEFAEPVDPISLTSQLENATHDCFVFCFNFSPGTSFVGATPECLFFRHGDVFESEVIAGTRVRGRDPEEDERLAEELLGSDKDQREHEIVRKSIRQKLHKFVDQLEVDPEASILRLARKQHLRSNVSATLKPNIHDGVLIERLHPTPAVGGYPTDNALREIARIESFNRGWYAAPVGWIGCDKTHFAVAIRSGLIESNHLSLFSGAGIVRGSEPEKEWLEVQNKIQDFMSVLG